MKKIFISLLLSLTFNAVAQQNSEKNYYIIKNDTVFCTNLTYETTAQGVLKSLKYTDESGKQVETKQGVSDVTTIYHFGQMMDKIPFKAEKPDGIQRFTERIVDGTLKVYLASQYVSNSGGSTGTYRFFIKFPDGTFCKINNKKNLNSIIKPYLLKCEAFKNAYTGTFSTREEPFQEMIRLYNSLCK